MRDELEHLLDDDEDMAEMYLTDKLVLQQLENSSTSSMNERGDMDDEVLRSDMDDRFVEFYLSFFMLGRHYLSCLDSLSCLPLICRLHFARIPAEISLEGGGSFRTYEGDNPQDQLFGAPNVLGRDSHGTHTSTTRSAISKNLDVEELEMLLEAYFVQIDGTLNKLSTVCNCLFKFKLDQHFLVAVLPQNATLIVVLSCLCTVEPILPFLFWIPCTYLSNTLVDCRLEAAGVRR